MLAVLDEQFLNTELDVFDLLSQLGAIVGGDRASNHGSRHTTGTSEGHFRGHEHVRGVFVFAQKRKVQKDGEWLRVSSQDDELRDTTVESLCCFVGALFQLAQVSSLKHQTQNDLRKVGIRKRVSAFVNFRHSEEFVGWKDWESVWSDDIVFCFCFCLYFCSAQLAGAEMP